MVSFTLLCIASVYGLSENGILLLPSTGKRTANGVTIQVKGRLSTDIIEFTMRGIIRDTKRALAPDSDNELANSVVRGAYLATRSDRREDAQIVGSFTSSKALNVMTSSAGIFEGTFEVQVPTNTNKLTYQIREDGRTLPLVNDIQILEPTGFSIISDIDDTIKVSEVNSRLATLTNTFFKKTKVVPGTPEYYKTLQALPGVSFHYLSASPFQILPTVQSFVENSFPKGEITLSTLSSTNFGVLFNPLQYKLDELERIISFLPQRKYIMIGDSTQADPEAYATTHAKYASQIQCIFIRRVKVDNNERENEEKNGAARFQKAFSGIPETKTFVFDEPSQLPSAAQLAAGLCRK